MRCVSTIGTFVKNLLPSNRKTKLIEHAVRLTVEHLETRILLTTNTWVAAGGGDWDTAGNWSLGHVPTANEDAVINESGNFTITHNSNVNDSVHSLISNQAFTFSAGTLVVVTTTEVDNTFTLQGGTLQGGTVHSGSGGQGMTIVYGTLSNTTVDANVQLGGGTLNDVIVNGNVQVANNGYGNATVTNGLVLNGTANVASSAGLVFADTESFGGTGTVVLQTGTSNLAVSGTTTTLTIGSGITIDGQNGATLTNSGNQCVLNNQGTIESNVSGSTLTISGAFTLVNSGTLKATNGGTLSVGPNSWYGTGVLESDSGSTFNIGGTYNNTNATLTLSGTGTFDITAGNTTTGTFEGGTLTVPATTTVDLFYGALSGVTVDGNFQTAAGTLNDVIVNGNVQVESNGYGYTSTVTNGLILNGTANVSSSAWLAFADTESFGGTGTVALQTGTSSLQLSAIAGTTTTLTVGSGITIDGQNGATITTSSGNSPCVLINQGTIESNTSGSTLTVIVYNGGYSPLTLINNGTLKATDGGTLTVGPNSWYGTGVLESDSGSTFNIGGTYNNTNAAVTLGGTGTFNITGTFQGGIVTVPTATLTASGTLNGTTVDGNIQVINSSVIVLNGLVLNGTATLPANIGFSFEGTQSLSGNGTVLFESSGGAASLTISPLNSSPATLTVGTGIVIEGQNGTINQSGSATLDNEGTILSSISGQSISIQTNLVNSGTIQAVDGGILRFQSTATNTGSIEVNGGNLYVSGALTTNSQGSLSESISSSVILYGSLLGNTTNSSLISLPGDVVLEGSGTQSSPQQIEAMSQDLGAVSSGFIDNYAFNSLSIEGGYTQLVDQSHNSDDSSAEAVYVNSLTVASTTLDLNGLHLYARTAQIQGTIINGSVTILPRGGSSMQFDEPVAGDITSAGASDHWTLYGQSGHAVNLSVDPGSGAVGSPVSPSIQWTQLQLISPTGATLATVNSSSANTVLNLSNVILPVSGNYTVVVRAASAQSGSTGNYALSAFDVTPTDRGQIFANQQQVGDIATPYAQDQWSLTIGAGAQVQLTLAAGSSAGLLYTLTGPGGYVGFSDVTAGTSQITLPSSGTYLLTVQGAGASTGSYAFRLFQPVPTPIPVNSLYSGTLTGSGQVQLFLVPVTATGPISIVLDDAAAADHNELYVKRGAVPTLASYDFSATGTGGSQQIEVPSGAAGNWYVMIYSENVLSAGTAFTLKVSTGVILTASTPATSTVGAANTLTITGAGFGPGTTVSLIASGGASYVAQSTLTDLPTQLTALYAAGTVPAGTYTILVTLADGATATLSNAITLVASGQANLTTNLELPNLISRHLGQTLYIDYSNTGTAPMAAPLLVLTATNPIGNGALFTGDPALEGLGLWSSVTPPGFSQTYYILANGATPGILQPGETERVPVYYAGWLENQWDFSDPTVTFSLLVIQANDTTPVNWAGLQSSLQPPGFTSAAWTTVYSNLQSQLGTTAGGYVQLLDNESSYLGRLGENVSVVSTLWGAAVEQADNAISPLSPFLASATDDSVATPGNLSLSFDRQFAQSISGRDIMSTLGMGWSDQWQESATIASSGSVTINEPGGGQRVFDPSSAIPGSYLSQPGNTGSLSADGSGGYLLTEANGIETDFTSAGLLNYMQDTDGNRITAGYSSGQLTSLTASSGQSITINYNNAGLVSSVTDSTGLTTTYSYDSTNTYLTSVTGYNGQTTNYSYDTSAGTAADGALTAITFPGGTHQYFTYDSLGRLSSTFGDGNASPETFTYNLGQVDITDGTGDTSALYYNEDGLVMRSVDALGNPTYYTYDSNFNLASVTNAQDESETYTYNSADEVTTSTDFLGNTTTFQYFGPYNQLLSMKDANGNTTGYAYDNSGDLLSTTYANGTISSSTYNPEGRVNRRGDTDTSDPGYQCCLGNRRRRRH
jgi:YD repeat-containing protein